MRERQKRFCWNASKGGGSNSDILAKECEKGAKEAGHEVEYITLKGKEIKYYEMCGQMKTLLDRLNPLYPTEYKFRDIYMIATAGEDEETTFDKAYNGLQGWVDCFEKAELKGIVTGGGIDGANDAAKHGDVMKKAYELGKRL